MFAVATLHIAAVCIKHRFEPPTRSSCKKIKRSVHQLLGGPTGSQALVTGMRSMIEPIYSVVEVIHRTTNFALKAKQIMPAFVVKCFHCLSTLIELLLAGKWSATVDAWRA